MKKNIIFITIILLTLTMPMTARAAEFVNSIMQKSPVLVSDSISVPNEKQLILTPISHADNAPNREITEILKETYTYLEETPLKEVNSDLDKEVKRIGDYTVDDLVVTQLFDLSLIDEEKNRLNEEIEQYTATIDFSLKPDDPIPVIIMRDNDNWVIVDISNITRNPDDTLTLTLERLTQFAVLIPDNKHLIVTNPENHSPQTSDDSTSPLPYVGIVLIGFTALLAGKFCYEKKSS